MKGKSHFSRRGFVQAGALGLMGLSLENLLPLQAGSGTTPRAKAVIYIFLSGGLSQIDSFDMKPDGPSAIKGEFQPIDTRSPGIQICEHLPMLAQRSQHWALCRSVTHPYNEHSQGHMVMLSGRTPMPPGFNASKPKPSDWPSIAAIANYAIPAKGNLPSSVVLPETLIHRTGRVIPGQFAGEMGSHWNPWVIKASPYNAATYGAFPEYEFHHAKGKKQTASLKFHAPNLSLPKDLPQSRLRDRLSLLQQIDRQQRELENQTSLARFSRHREQAISLLADAKVKRAFDVLKAVEKEQERYGRNQFGWSLLMARRLVEAGVNLVQVNLGNNETWDTHQALFPNMKNFLLPPTDRAVSALLDDLHASGRLDETLIVMAGEFGRTPRIFKIPKAPLPGRDHWGKVQTVFFAGGGVKGGTIIGSSDKQGGEPATEPQTPENLAATIYQALGIPANAAWRDPADRPHFIYHDKPIPGLIQ